MQGKADISVASRIAFQLGGLQILRGLAAAAVVVHHALEVSNGAASSFSPDFLTTSGAAGVDVFFVISGFIILYTSFPPGRRPLAPSTFILRRIVRIYPMYWICCACTLGIMSFGFLQNHHLDLTSIALSLALLPSPKLILDISWTLVYEIYFYAIFALALTRFSSAFGSALFTTAAIILFMLGGLMLDDGVLKNFLSDPVVYEFVLGLWLAIGFLRWSARWPVLPAVAVGAVILLMLAPLFIVPRDTGGLTDWWRPFAWGLPAAFLVGALLAIPEPKDGLQRHLAHLGDASYALYLTHIFTMLGYAILLRKTAITSIPQILVVPIIVLIALAVGVFAHRYIEKPLLQFAKRWTNQAPLTPQSGRQTR
jgi:exopolysaccharide production protein ExoZ